MTPPAPKRPTGGAEPFDRRDLLKAYKDVLHEEKEKLSQPGGATKPAAKVGFWILTLALLGLGLGSLLLHPEWFFPKERVETPVVKEASLRLLMYREILHVEQFRRANGRLPSSLKEAGGDDSAVQYIQQGNSYLLKGRNGSLELTYDSATPASAFLGDSYEKVRGRAN